MKTIKTFTLLAIALFGLQKVNAQSWNLSGNSNINSSTNFLGTTDSKPLIFKTNNAEQLRILSQGQIGIGITNPLQKLDVNGNINIDSGFALYIANHKTLSMDSVNGNTFLGNGVAVRNTGKYNSISGFQAFNSNTTGTHNTANGYKALYSNTTGYYNMASGSFALYHNTTGSQNIAAGYEALYTNTTGSSNVAIGHFALALNTTGGFNTATGEHTLFSNTSGIDNVANGSSALYNNTTGNNNTANGTQALYYNTTGSDNIATGTFTLGNNISGFGNTATGNYSLNNNASGYYNNATGYYSLYSNTDGHDNAAYGSYALANNTGSSNTAIGRSALYSTTTGEGNTAVGVSALQFNTDSWYNTAIGYNAAYAIHTGWNNTFLGSSTSANEDEIYNSTAIGNNTYVETSNQVRIGNNFITSIGGNVDWTTLSDERVKKNIKENIPGLTFINKLKPVSYNLDLDALDKIVHRPAVKDKDGKLLTQKISQVETDARNAKQQIVYTGFVAQDVERAAKELNYNFSGVDAAKNDKDLYGLRYSEFVVPLVKAVQELSKQNDELKQRIEKLESLVNISNQPANVSSALLEQNIPNPLTKNTSIGYTIPVGMKAQIIITDNNGSTIKQIVLNGSGKGVVNIDASTLSTGTYYYTLIVDGKKIDTKKMILTK